MRKLSGQTTVLLSFGSTTSRKKFRDLDSRLGDFKSTLEDPLQCMETYLQVQTGSQTSGTLSAFAFTDRDMNTKTHKQVRTPMQNRRTSKLWMPRSKGIRVA